MPKSVSNNRGPGILAAVLLPLGLITIGSFCCPSSHQVLAQANERVGEIEVDLNGPPPIPDYRYGKELPTVPVRKDSSFYRRKLINTYDLEAKPVKRVIDRDDIYILGFSYKPVRLIDVEIPGVGRQKVHYLYFRIVNLTGESRLFVPQFTLVTDTGQIVRDTVLPQAIEVIDRREDYQLRRPYAPLLGAIDLVGQVPVSQNDDSIDGVYGVAIFRGVDRDADAFSIYVTGLSDGYVEVQEGGQALTRYKTLKLDFDVPGDRFDITEREIRPMEPAWDWIYWNPTEAK